MSAKSLEKSPLRVRYDEIGDVLYVSAGKNTHTDNEEVEDGLYLRYDSDTHKPAGAIVVDYKEYWCLRRRTHLVKLLARFFGMTDAAIRSALKSKNLPDTIQK